jgi:putative membrane protein
MYGLECMHDFGWGGVMMGFFAVAFWIVIIIVAYVVIRNISSKGGGLLSTETPIDILKKRYARGEISKEEFEQMKRDLAS